MTGPGNRYELDRAVGEFRRQRVALIREGGEEAAARLTLRAVTLLNGLTREAESALDALRPLRKMRRIRLWLRSADEEGEDG